MYSITIKGSANPKDPSMVKLKMIFFKTGSHSGDFTLQNSHFTEIFLTFYKSSNLYIRKLLNGNL